MGLVFPPVLADHTRAGQSERRRELWQHYRIRAEHSAATAYAAVQTGRILELSAGKSQ